MNNWSLSSKTKNQTTSHHQPIYQIATNLKYLCFRFFSVHFFSHFFFKPPTGPSRTSAGWSSGRRCRSRRPCRSRSRRSSGKTRSSSASRPGRSRRRRLVTFKLITLFKGFYWTLSISFPLSPSGNRRGHRLGGRDGRGQNGAAPAPAEDPQDRRQPGRELLLLLADDGHDLHPVQPVDADRAAELPGAAGERQPVLAQLRLPHGLCLHRGRGRSAAHRLPRAGPDGLFAPCALAWGYERRRYWRPFFPTLFRRFTTRRNWQATTFIRVNFCST